MQAYPHPGLWGIHWCSSLEIVLAIACHQFLACWGLLMLNLLWIQAPGICGSDFFQAEKSFRVCKWLTSSGVLTLGLNEFPGRKGRAIAPDLLLLSHRIVLLGISRCYGNSRFVARDRFLFVIKPIHCMEVYRSNQRTVSRLWWSHGQRWWQPREWRRRTEAHNSYPYPKKPPSRSKIHH